MIINKTSDKIAKLAHDLRTQGFVDEAIEVATKSSELDDLLRGCLPITKSVMADAIFNGNTAIYQARESLMFAFYVAHLKKYEALINT